MFDWLYSALGTLLSWFSAITGGSYALALLIYALVFKIVFLPFSIKQQKNQIKMAKLTPKIELIKAKYKGRNDRVSMQKMQQEIMELQQQEGYSVMSGCLPMLIQLPLIIFLYNVIRNPLTYICKISADGIARIKELLSLDAGLDEIGVISAMNNAGKTLEDLAITAERALPNFDFFGYNLAEIPSLAAFSILCIIPFLAAGLQWFTMFITRKVNGNANQLAGDGQTQASLKMMDIIFPLMTLWLTFSFSAMMGLYWIYQSLIAIVQTLIISKVMPMPRYTEEELKAMRKAQKEQEKAQRAALKTQPKHKSLHYIDEDDYDELPTMTKNGGNSGAKPSSSQDIPEIKD